jgi:hypothetical protein
MASKRSHLPLSKSQRRAIALLQSCVGYDNGWGVVSTETAKIGGQPWVHWRIAEALSDRGLVEIQSFNHCDELRLTEEGRRV